MHMHVHTPGRPRFDRGPHPVLTVTEGLAALVLLVGLIGGGAAALTWATVLGFTYLTR
jgi:hypothetical protein